MKYTHLFFDLDHTLWDFETNAREVLHELHELNNLADQGITDRALFYERYSFHNARLWDRYSKGMIRQEELRWKRMWLALLDFKIGSEALARTMAVQFLDRLPFKQHLFPYAAEILEYLKQKGYTLHLITNGFEMVQHHKLKSSGIHTYFGHVITSEGSNSLKPQKAIFEYALRLSGADRQKSIMLGDNLEADIRGALNAGLDAVFVNHLNVAHTAAPTFEVRHLKELEQLF
jgi:putative hydrolase of the HAD superfamily